MELSWEGFGASFLHRADRPVFIGFDYQTPPFVLDSVQTTPAFRKLEVKPGECANTEHAAGWLSETLSTVTSNVFTELAVSITVSHAANENLMRGWGSVHRALDQFGLYEGVALVARWLHWMRGIGSRI